MSRGNKKGTVMGLFFSMFLRATVVLLGILIVVLGAMFVVQLTKGTDKDNDKSTSSVELTDGQRDDLLSNTADPTTEAVTEEPTTEVQRIDAKDKKIAVLNSTDVAGLAGAWTELLGEDGYDDCKAADYFNNQENTKIVSKEAGVGEELVQYFSDATYEVGELTEGSDEDLAPYDLIIIIGNSDNILSSSEE